MFMLFLLGLVMVHVMVLVALGILFLLFILFACWSLFCCSFICCSRKGSWSPSTHGGTVSSVATMVTSSELTRE